MSSSFSVITRLLLLFTSSSADAGALASVAGAAPSRVKLGNARSIGHLQNRLAHPHDVADLKRSHRLQPIAIHERAVRRPEIFDRELTALAAHERAWRRNLRVVPSRLPPGCSAPTSSSPSTVSRASRAFPSLTSSCSPAIGTNPTPRHPQLPP